jgi:cytochrome c oxidase subunit II
VSERRGARGPRAGPLGGARRRLLLAATALALPLWACNAQGPNALDPAGPAARHLAWLWWVMLAMGAAVILLVLSLLAIALFRRRREPEAPPPLGTTGFIVGGGVALPLVVGIALMVLTVGAAGVNRPSGDENLTVEVIGHKWWWEVRYPEEDVVTANEIRIPVGRPVRLVLRSADVIHSFWVPELQGKMDLTPGREDEMVIEAERAGTYRGQCAEYCGLQHARMAMLVIAEEEADFAEWMARRQQPAEEPQEPALRLGREVFMSSSCVYCHAIRGTPARGELGPDLSDIGSRLTLGAAQFPNNRGNLAGWITDPQSMKPGNRMPATFLRGEQLQALLDYMESLE